MIMPKKLQTNFLPFLFYLILTYLAYYLLLYGKRLHTSISQIISMSHNLSLKPHLLVLGMLPIYISIMIFGAGILGIYLGQICQQFLVRSPQKIEKKHLDFKI